MYYVLFADDTNVFISGNNLRKLINTLHIELDKLYAWLQSNKLTLNLLKTHYMVFHRDKHKNMDGTLCINKVPIQQVDNTTFLGVIIYDNLNWSNHISYINSKIAKGIGIICRARKFFSKSALINLYYAFIFVYLIYCVEVWGNALSTHTQPLIKLQNTIIRIITNCHLLAYSEKLYNETCSLPFVTLVKYRIGLLMFKIVKLTVPISISRLFKLNNSDVHNYNTRQAHHIHSFKGNNELIYRTFKFQSVYVWNSILQNINIHVSFPICKHLLKRFLLNNNTSVRYDK